MSKKEKNNCQPGVQGSWVIFWHLKLPRVAIILAQAWSSHLPCSLDTSRPPPAPRARLFMVPTPAQAPPSLSLALSVPAFPLFLRPTSTSLRLPCLGCLAPEHLIYRIRVCGWAASLCARHGYNSLSASCPLHPHMLLCMSPISQRRKLRLTEMSSLGKGTKLGRGGARATPEFRDLRHTLWVASGLA